MDVRLGPGAWVVSVRRLRCDLSWRLISKFCSGELNKVDFPIYPQLKLVLFLFE